MPRFINWLFIFILASVMGCSVISSKNRSAKVDADFTDLMRAPEHYTNSIVVVGGYVISVANQTDQTIIHALQAPLGSQDRPKARDLSHGRLQLVYAGFLDPEVYRKDRLITVAGRLIGSTSSDVDQATIPLLSVQINEIYLWPEEEDLYYDPFWYDVYPYGHYHRWHHRPWFWRPHFHHRHRHR